MNTPHIRFRKRHDEGQNIHNTRSFLCMTMYHARYFHFRIPSPFQVVILKAYLVTHSYPKLIQSSSFQRAVFFRIPSPPCSPYVIHYLLHFVASPPHPGFIPSPSELGSFQMGGTSRVSCEEWFAPSPLPSVQNYSKCCSSSCSSFLINLSLSLLFQERSLSFGCPASYFKPMMLKVTFFFVPSSFMTKYM